MGKNARKGSEGDGEGRKTKKPKWTAKAQGQGQAMPSGSKGVLITVDPGKEKRAGYEAINLLNEFHDKLCGGGSADRPAGEPAGPESSQGVPDIQAEIAREVEGIQDRSCQRFRFHDTGMRGLIYIIQQSPRSSSAPDESQAAGAADGNGKGQEAGGGAEEVDPVDLVVTLLKDAQATKQCRTRHCIRWIPVCQVVRPSLEAMKEAAAGFVAPRFTTDAALGASAAGHDNGNDGQNAASARQPTRSSSSDQQQDGTDSAADGGPAAASGAEGAHKPSSTAGGGLGGGWRVSVNVERRALPGVDRKEVIDTFINQVPCPPHKVDLDHPQRTISVQIIRNACGLAVLPDYFELLKYNIRSLAGVDPDTGLAKE